MRCGANRSISIDVPSVARSRWQASRKIRLPLLLPIRFWSSVRPGEAISNGPFGERRRMRVMARPPVGESRPRRSEERTAGPLGSTVGDRHQRRVNVELTRPTTPAVAIPTSDRAFAP